MTIRNSIVALAFCLVTMATGLTLAFTSKAAPPQRAQGAKTPLTELPPGLGELKTEPENRYVVAPHPPAPNELRSQVTTNRLQQAVEIFSANQPIPEDRLRFFQWLDHENSPLSFYGWGVLVKDVSPSPEGWVISVIVTPHALKGGKAAVIANQYTEVYLWANGQLTYLRGFGDATIAPSYMY